ncbi:CFEM domain-containing protein [Xylariaceae sp. FL1272]|nr:CFEM domain-containing protein [Xylariaceae sp. FL1272]
MRVSAHILTAAAVLAGVVAAQSSALTAAAASYPACARPCLAETVPASGCLQGTPAEQLECICTNQALTAAITECVLSSCTTYEGLMVKNATVTLCGGPVRDETLEPLLVGVIGGAIALLAFSGRMLSAIMPSAGRLLGWDDWTMVATVLLAVPPTIFAVTLSLNGLGKDIWTLPLKNIENVLFYYYLGEIFYFAALTMNKISILLFMLRVFPKKTFRKIIYVVIGLCVAYGLSFVFATAFQCTPVDYSWLQIDSTVQGHCNNINLQGWMSAIWNIVIDIIIIVLPLKDLYELQLALKKKLMVMLMFSLGIFVTVVSAIRLNSLIVFANTQNPTYDYKDAAWWSTVELHTGIVCACLPSLRSLFVSLGVRILGSTKGNSRATGYAHDVKRSQKSSRTGTSTNEKISNVPKHGDEGDFIPLVNVQDQKTSLNKTSTNLTAIREQRSYDSDMKNSFHDETSATPWRDS